ncbi:uncharacterized protein KQ657_003498 [Scheffersomyces spartinae]|uniref:Peptide-methionine (R)-S-oxide reductase n=1 Tax=Scheffersomyces spartinae TaxID=45513 RepID=A0A9P7V4W2_9ASCO|nr:uncharacterized protein KQ657_003498 [Scheffersomyces spartinae]KAG7191377.1 hypothetical protein KQ657_003498 [Scheffersomyces spartinae]
MSKVVKSDSEWRLQLLPAAFKVLRQGGTEPAGTGEYNRTPAKENGVYRCVGCSNPLYKALTKFDSHCGWPAFFEAIPGSITTLKDTSFGMVREEMRCAKCDGHLGHIFRGEGYKNPTDERHCVNSVCLKFSED